MKPFQYRFLERKKKLTKFISFVQNSGPVTNAENIKADRPKILRPTHFSCMKDIKADSFLALTNINADMFESGE